MRACNGTHTNAPLSRIPVDQCIGLQHLGWFGASSGLVVHKGGMVVGAHPARKSCLQILPFPEVNDHSTFLNEIKFSLIPIHPVVVLHWCNQYQYRMNRHLRILDCTVLLRLKECSYLRMLNLSPHMPPLQLHSHFGDLSIISQHIGRTVQVQ